MEVTTSNQDRQIDVFELDLGDYTNQGLVLALSGVGGSSGEGLTLMGVTSEWGSIFHVGDHVVEFCGVTGGVCVVWQLSEPVQSVYAYRV